MPKAAVAPSADPETPEGTGPMADSLTTVEGTPSVRDLTIVRRQVVTF